MPAQLSPSPLLRTGLRLDAVASGGLGLLLAVGQGPAAQLLGLPAPLLFAGGLVCLAWAGLTFWLSRRETLASTWVWAVIALNAVWTIESIVGLAAGFVSPTGLGTAFVILQAVLVAGFAEMQYLGLRRSRPEGFAAA
jgi:hypothetical protein